MQDQRRVQGSFYKFNYRRIVLSIFSWSALGVTLMRSTAALAVPVSIILLEDEAGKRVLLVGDRHIENHHFNSFENAKQNTIKNINQEFGLILANLQFDGNLGVLIPEYSKFKAELGMGCHGDYGIPNFTFLDQFSRYYYENSGIDVLCSDLTRGHMDFTKLTSNSLRDGTDLTEHFRDAVDYYEQRANDIPERSPKREALVQLMKEYKAKFLPFKTKNIFNEAPDMEAIVNIVHALDAEDKDNALVYLGADHVRQMLPILTERFNFKILDIVQGNDDDKNFMLSEDDLKRISFSTILERQKKNKENKKKKNSCIIL